MSVRHALLSILCSGQPTLDRGYVGWGTPGFFSMLNSAADELLRRVYRGERPFSSADYYASTRLIGYGNATFASFARPWECATFAARMNVSDAIALLIAASRYVVASHLLHLVYRPWALQGSAASTRYALAIHLRRGDKLTEGRNSERISIWTEHQVVEAAIPQLRGPRRHSKQEHNPLDSITADGEAHGDGPTGDERRSDERPLVLLASDDNAFASRVERLLLAQGVRVERPPNDHDHGTAAPSDACDDSCIPNIRLLRTQALKTARPPLACRCDDSCIPPLLALVDGFARADALMLSTKSNMGSYLLSWWAAANADRPPPLLDTDGKAKQGQLQRGRYFCSLAWGSRHGMCESNRTREP